MKLENLLLRSMFAASLMLSTLILGSMMFGHPTPRHAAASAQTAQVAQTPPACPLPPDGVVCPRTWSGNQPTPSDNG